MYVLKSLYLWVKKDEGSIIILAYLLTVWMSFQLSLKSLKPKSAKNKRKLASSNTGTDTLTELPSSSRTAASNLTFDEADDGYPEGSAAAAEQANLGKKRRIKITHVDSCDAQSDATGADKPKVLTIKLDENETEFSTQLVTTQEEYDAVPVELFGDAILRGMGWDGKYDDDDNKKKPIMPHPEGLGIGAKGSNDITDIDSFMPIIEVKKKKERINNEEEGKGNGEQELQDQ